ncbi:MAG: amidohydrolase family protein [Bacteroidales bacterium]
MRRLCAHYIFPISSPPIPKGILTLDDEGVIVSLSQMQGEEEGLEFYNGILVPGFINAHCHLELSYYKGAIERGIGLSKFLAAVGALHRSQDLGQVKSAIERVDAQMYQSGTLAVGDISNNDISFSHKRESLIHYHSFVEASRLWTADAERYMLEAKKYLSIAKNMGLSASLSPHALYTTPVSFLEAIAQDSSLFSIHFLESEEEHQFFEGSGGIFELFKKLDSTLIDTQIRKKARQHLASSLAYLEKILLVHNTHSSREDVEFVQSFPTKSFWILCPRSNVYIEDCLPPVMMLRSKGAQIAIGTDSLMSNESLQMIDELKLISEAFPDISLNEMLTWATLNGAMALGMEKDFGSFTIGKKPGVVHLSSVDLQQMRLTTASQSRLLTKK